MDLGQVNRWRDLASKIAAAFCVIALLGLVDGLLVHFREPANLVKVLPGASRRNQRGTDRRGPPTFRI